MTCLCYDKESSLFLATHRSSHGAGLNAALNVFSASVCASSRQYSTVPRATMQGHRCAVSLSRAALFSVQVDPLAAVADASFNQVFSAL